MYKLFGLCYSKPAINESIGNNSFISIKHKNRKIGIY